MHPRQSLSRSLCPQIGFALASFTSRRCYNNSAAGDDGQSSLPPAPLPEKRPSRRRYSAHNTRGRSSHVKELIDRLKSKDSAEAAKVFSSLMPRDKLDVLRALHVKRTKRKQHRRKSGLPRHRSAVFERRYFFKEEDLEESSTLGRGPGGQATNRRMQTVILKHTPSGIVVKFSRFPSLWLNRRAARELLNLRLEEHLLGDKSELGSRRVQKEKRRQRREAEMNRMAVKGNILAARETQQRHYYRFLKGQEGLPPLAMSQLGEEAQSGASDSGLVVTDLFEQKCHLWWPMLHGAYSRCTPHVPLILQYVFPAPDAEPAGSAQETKYVADQLTLCREDEEARSNVVRGLRCFCELFGLRLVDTVRKSDGAARRVVTKDGTNWLELRGRMIGGDNSSTELACVAWPHVVRSLHALGLTQEASAVKGFFKREAREAKNSWAMEIQAAIRS